MSERQITQNTFKINPTKNIYYPSQEIIKQARCRRKIEDMEDEKRRIRDTGDPWDE